MSASILSWTRRSGKPVSRVFHTDFVSASRESEMMKRAQSRSSTLTSRLSMLRVRRDCRPLLLRNRRIFCGMEWVGWSLLHHAGLSFWNESRDLLLISPNTALWISSCETSILGWELELREVGGTGSIPRTLLAIHKCIEYMEKPPLDSYSMLRFRVILMFYGKLVSRWVSAFWSWNYGLWNRKIDEMYCDSLLPI